MDDKTIDELHALRAQAYDAARPEAVARVHENGRLTARERIEGVLDAGTFVESGVLAGGAEEPAGGYVTGIGTLFGKPIAIGSYDYSVHGGTQTGINHAKIDRTIELAHRYRWPFVCFADGGGARAQGLAGRSWGSGMSTAMGTFDGMAYLSGWVPTVAVVSGRSFAGNASIAGFSDVVFATRGSAIGMGGPPLVEAALGLRMTPEELAPSEMHERTGGIDLLIEDDAEGVALVRKYLAYFLVEKTEGTPSREHDTIRAIVPDNRRRPYDMRKIVAALADADSVFELRPNWATAAITALARMGGHAVAIIANQPKSNIAGAIDANAADKLARFIQLADAYDIPIVSLMDNPGFMLGPDAERAGIARHHARPLLAQVDRTVPLFLVHIRKAYGLGPMAMGSMFQPTDLRLAWPTVEAGGMALEGAAALIQRKEIREAGGQAAAREKRDELADQMRERSLWQNAGRNYTFDEVIDPAETRDRIIAMLRFIPKPPPRTKRKHYIDTW
ncbi:MAG: biotin carboxylase [Chloroflexi bacterium]|nr:biotin carboxylase [Chloroflexota bacterium]